MNLQEMINQQSGTGRLELPPGEFIGQVLIDRPLTIVGSGRATWIGSDTSPTIRIISARVKLQNLCIECTAPYECVAVDAPPGTNPLLEQVIVKGTIKGFRPERVTYACAVQEPSSPKVRQTPDPRFEQLSADRVRAPSPEKQPVLDSRRGFARGDGIREMPGGAPVPEAPKAGDSSLTKPRLFSPKLAVVVLGLAGIVLLTVVLFPRKGTEPVTTPPKVIAQEDADLPDFARIYPADIKRLYIAALRGEAWAQAQLGYEYTQSKVIPIDDSEAAKWYRKAVEQGSVMAQCNLGNLYASGRGVEQDYAEAVRLYRMAADQGNAVAQTNLANMYIHGRGTVGDDTEAVKLLRKAVDQGNAKAQLNLGWMYEMGRGVTQDHAEAVKWYRMSADQGEAVAQCNLGLMYENGRGVPKNREEAIKWYRKAAAQENERAMERLRQIGASP